MSQKIFRKEGSTVEGEEFSIQQVVRCRIRGENPVKDFKRFLDEKKIIPIFIIIQAPDQYDCLFWVQDDQELGEFELGYYRDEELPKGDA